jgi:hypothetical protein
VYQEHPAFRAPQDEHVKVWRYMNFTKFISLLDRRAFFFARADKLSDPFEGRYPTPNVINRCQRLDASIGGKDAEDTLAVMSCTFQSLCERVLVSCWHMSGYESAAMWNLYTLDGEGVAIQSTFRRLCDGFAPAIHEVHAGIVAYANYETDLIPEDNVFHAYLCKRQSFEHEKELRVIHFDASETGCRYGLYIPVDLSTLVERVYIAPFAEEWFCQLVRSAVDEYRAGLHVHKSAIDSDPIY